MQFTINDTEYLIEYDRIYGWCVHGGFVGTHYKSANAAQQACIDFEMERL